MNGKETVKKIWAEKLGRTTVKALNQRFFDAFYCEDGRAAVKKALELIPVGSSVAWGGSATLQEIGLIDKIRGGNYEVIDRDAAKNREEAENISRRGMSADVFLTSSNAVSEDGQLINVDGTGNRAAAIVFGPKSVIVIAGINKIAKDTETALKRARTVAAPMNMQRFAEKKAPCSVNGACSDCISPDCICASVLLTRISKPAGKIKVIIVGETLGF